MTTYNLLITGATGYIGGTVLNHFLASTNPSTKALNVSVLIRDDARKVGYYQSLPGIHKVHTFKDLDDAEAITAAVSQHDILIHLGVSYHPASARSHIEGLALRQQATGRPTYYIHQSGTSDFADRPVTNIRTETREFSDLDHDLYTYLRALEDQDPYHQRVTSLTVTETGLAKDVATTVVTPPTIYGMGTGPYNRISMQIPWQTQATLKHGSAEYIGNGEGVWDFVHVADLAALYELVVLDWVEDRKLVPTGTTGYLFTAAGRYSWRDLARAIAVAGKNLGYLTTDDVASVPLDEAAARWIGTSMGLSGPELLQTAELGFASSERTRADVAARIGWVPARTEADFWADVAEVFRFVAERDGAPKVEAEMRE